MKKWQKIAGTITLIVLAALNIILCVYYLEYATSIYFEPGGSTQDAIQIMRTHSRYAIKNISYLVHTNYIVALFLFICLWRKGMNKTYPSPIKTISVEKIIIPFTFERAYCRIGVTTDNSGIERMEVYFVRNDKTAICYANSSFNQVVIDDAKLDKYDNLKINIGTINSIRETIGLANHIIKLSDERLIVFEVLPKGYGELYESVTIIAPSDDEYSDYLEDYKQGKEIDF